MTSVGIMASGVGIAAPSLFGADPCNNFTYAPWTVNGSVTVAAGGKTGNGFSFPSGSTNYLTYNLAAGAQTDTLTAGCWIKLGTFSASQNILEWRSDTGATQHVAVRVGTSGQVSVVRIGGSTLGATSANGTVVVGTWAYLEASVKLHDTAGFAIVRVDGVEVAGGTGVDTKNLGTKTVFDQFRINSAGSITTWLVDDVYLRSDASWGP